jgi:hypothetical protein
MHGSTAVPPGLFNENATGRINPLGNFTGFVDSIEYFFGLAPKPGPPNYDVISAADVAEFTSGCAEVAASVVDLTTSAHNPGAPSHVRSVSDQAETGQLPHTNFLSIPDAVPGNIKKGDMTNELAKTQSR